MKFNQMFKGPTETQEQRKHGRQNLWAGAVSVLLLQGRQILVLTKRLGLEPCYVAVGKQALGKKLLFIS